MKKNSTGNSHMELHGKYASAKIFTDVIDETSIAQIINLLNQPFAKGCNLRMMPDVHAGKGCTIGTTMIVSDKVCANLVGVDIGCGMLTVQVQIDDLKELDEAIAKVVPSGANVHQLENHSFDEKLEKLKCYTQLNGLGRIRQSLGTLGGGNHFIELDAGSDGQRYLIVHSGSRNLGKQVCTYYHEQAIKQLCGATADLASAKSELIATLIAKGQQRDIAAKLKELEAKFKAKQSSIDKNLAYMTGSLLEDYLHDMSIVNEYADCNRLLIAENILKALGEPHLSQSKHFTTRHNYIDTENKILRKGAISALQGEVLLIPINMRDGCILGKGKGNPDWNYSGPHGAGRLLSRSAAKEQLSLDDFKKQMEGVYTTSVVMETLDEAPSAYKSIDDIFDNIADTVDVIDVLKPLYNYKAH